MSGTRDSLLILESCVVQAKARDLPIESAFEGLKESSFYVIVFILCLPFLQPFSLGPLSTVGGLTLASLGWQLFRGDNVPWLPEKVRKIELSEKTWARLCAVCRYTVGFSATLARPRFGSFVEGRKGRQVIGILIILGGLLMAIPFAGVPLNNTLPAIMIVAAAIAALERDGLFLIVSFVFLVVTIAYFVALFWGIALLGQRLWEYVPTF